MAYMILALYALHMIYWFMFGTLLASAAWFFYNEYLVEDRSDKEPAFLRDWLDEEEDTAWEEL